MTEEFAIQILHEAIFTTLLVAAPLLGASLVVGLLISLFQAMTQINEATLTFIPKILAIALVLLLLLPWMAKVFLTYTMTLFSSFPLLSR
jgi:flagellar biosynthetic protein FliQ